MASSTRGDTGDSAPPPLGDHGRIELDTLRHAIADGRIETVLTVMPDLYGRLMGKRIVGRYFLEEIAGDGMTCIWTALTRRKDIAALACQAALEIQRAIDRFNAEHADTPFRTRIGLHAGNVALGIIGGEGHYQLAVGGDVANTAARLESDINKLLRTNLLVSDAVRADLDSQKTRKVGTFVPRGKKRAIAVYEIRDAQRQPAVDAGAFEAALADFESGDWQAARAGFESLGQAFPGDGPTAFYMTLLDLYAADRGRCPRAERRRPVTRRAWSTSTRPGSSRLPAAESESCRDAAPLVANATLRFGSLVS